MGKKTRADQYPALPHMLKAIGVADIVRTDRSTVTTKGLDGWVFWFKGPGVSNDFMLDRDQPDAYL